MPLREQNRLLLASGHAPAYPEHDLGDPSMAEVSAAIEALLAAYHPLPALVIDQGWDLVSANDAVYGLLDGSVDPALLEPPVNVIRLSLHPRGLAPRIVNLGEWRAHLLRRLRREYDASGARGWQPCWASPARSPTGAVPPTTGLVVPLRLRVGDRTLSLLSTTTVFGTPREVTLAELAIEAFLPADDATRAALG